MTLFSSDAKFSVSYSHMVWGHLSYSGPVETSFISYYNNGCRRRQFHITISVVEGASFILPYRSVRRKKADGRSRNNKRRKHDKEEADDSDFSESNIGVSDDCDDDSDENRIVDVGASYVIEELEDHKETQQGREYLVRWRGYVKRTWERVARTPDDTGVNRQLAEDYDLALISSTAHVREGSRRRDIGGATGRRQQAANSISQRSDSICTVCFKSGALLDCHLCPRAYHRNCITASRRIKRGSFNCASIETPVNCQKCTSRTDPISEDS